jgi:hypothetical protein
MFHASNTLSQVWENETQYSQVVFPLWKFEYYGVIKFWDKSENNKWCPNQTFFRLFERYWSLIIENGITFFIWRFENQVINQRKVKNQIGSLTSNY